LVAKELGKWYPTENYLLFKDHIMTIETPAQIALTAARAKVKALAETGRGTDLLVPLAEVEVRAEQARQQEIANLIAMLSNPAACPYPARDVLDKLKELVKL
jgi:hypothetical protein